MLEEAVEIISNVTESAMDAVSAMVNGTLSDSGEKSDGEAGSGSGSGSDEEEVEEWIIIDENMFYLGPIMKLLAMFHSLISFSMLVAYYHLKVPLAIFKREKEIARTMEFEGMYITEEVGEDDLKCHWDKLVISTR